MVDMPPFSSCSTIWLPWVTAQSLPPLTVFNSALPCSGKIVDVKTDKDTATATFVLGDRKANRCDSPGAKAIAAVKVLHGKIVLWHQLPSPQPLPPPPV